MTPLSMTPLRRASILGPSLLTIAIAIALSWDLVQRGGDARQRST